ncbi:MAG TPA: MFS transporter [Gemmatales bacterium]|nr:MFS transporter [Gemmatales bacterium]HMP58703.1 MFS transporter [Gemmatales bacterium]
MSAAAENAPTSVPNTHPPAFYFFFWGEFAERCSYYGMRAILPLYLTGILQFSEADATALYSYFKAACYLLPLLGGYLADRYFGKYWTIVGFSIPYVIGQFLLCVPEQMMLIVALILLAGGSGVIKPNISTLMGQTYDQKRPGRSQLRTSAFLWFYFSINIGAMLSLYALPEIRTYLTKALDDPTRAYQFTFIVPGLFMIGALVVFALGKKHYATETVGPPPPKTPEESAAQWRVLARLFGVFGLMVFFWMAYEQNDNIWVFFARDHMDHTLNLGFWSKTFAPDGFQFFNAMFVLMLIPFFDFVFRKFDPGVRFFKPTTKMLIGFIVTALASGVMALAAEEATTGVKVSAWWLVGAYFVLTVGEVLIYGTGLELAFAAAPAHMKGFVTACFLLTNTIGNLIHSQLGQLYSPTLVPDPSKFQLTPTTFFTMTMVITLVASVAFYFVGRRFNR